MDFKLYLLLEEFIFNSAVEGIFQIILNIELKQWRLDQTLYNAASDLGMCRWPMLS